MEIIFYVIILGLIKTTQRYLHVRKEQPVTNSPLDGLWKKGGVEI